MNQTDKTIKQSKEPEIGLETLLEQDKESNNANNTASQFSQISPDRSSDVVSNMSSRSKGKSISRTGPGTWHCEHPEC